jgi:excisionase family DNA binding protein
MNDRALLRVEEAAEILGIGRSKTYALVLSGSIPSVRFGRSVRIPRNRLETWIDEQVRLAEVGGRAGSVSPNATPTDDREG